MKISIKSKVADFKLRVSDKQLGINILIICIAVLTSSFMKLYFGKKGV